MPTTQAEAAHALANKGLGLDCSGTGPGTRGNLPPDSWGGVSLENKVRAALRVAGALKVPISFNASSNWGAMFLSVPDNPETMLGLHEVTGAGPSLRDISAEPRVAFVVSPDGFDPTFYQSALQNRVVLIEGGQTPREWTASHRAGANFALLVGANEYGPNYLTTFWPRTGRVVPIAASGAFVANVVPPEHRADPTKIKPAIQHLINGGMTWALQGYMLTAPTEEAAIAWGNAFLRATQDARKEAKPFRSSRELVDADYALTRAPDYTTMQQRSGLKFNIG